MIPLSIKSHGEGRRAPRRRRRSALWLRVCGFPDPPRLAERLFNESLSVCFCNLMLDCVGASCLEEASRTTETHAKQNPWLAPRCGHGAFASLRSAAPVPAFYKCPIWQEPCPAVSLKVLVQIPPSNVNPVQILNGPNYAFQIVSSHIIFREKRGLCFINSTGGRWRELKSRMSAASFFLIGARSGGFLFVNLPLALPAGM